jgi:hypothetical protein
MTSPEEIDDICTNWADKNLDHRPPTIDRGVRAKKRAAQARERRRRWGAINPDKIRANQQRCRQKKRDEIESLKKERAMAIYLAEVFYEAWRTKQPAVALADFYQLKDLLSGNGISKSILPTTPTP